MREMEFSFKINPMEMMKWMMEKFWVVIIVLAISVTFLCLVNYITSRGDGQQGNPIGGMLGGLFGKKNGTVKSNKPNQNVNQRNSMGSRGNSTGINNLDDLERYNNNLNQGSQGNMGQNSQRPNQRGGPGNFRF